MLVTFSRFSSKARKGVLVVSPEPSRVVIGRASLKSVALPLKEDYLYFGRISELPDSEIASRTNLILLKDESTLSTIFRHNHTNIMLASSEESFNELCNDLHTTFDTLMQVNNFASQLLTLVQNESRTEELLELGYQVFGNPLLLLDTTLCLIHSKGADTVVDDPIIEYVTTRGYMPERFIEEVMKEEENTSSEDDKTLIIWEKDFLKNRLIAGRIVRGTRLIAYLKLFECNRPINEVNDIEMFKVLCQYLALSMERKSSARQPSAPFVETFLLDIIERKLIDPAVIQERIDLYNLEFHENMLVIIVEMEERFCKTDKLYLLKQMLQNLFKRNTVFIYGTSIVIVYDRNDVEELGNQNLVDEFSKLLKNQHCHAGISLPFRQLSALYKYYCQAAVCFQVAARINCDDVILRYENQMLSHLLLSFGDAFDLYDLVPPSIWKLRKIDREKGSELTASLFCFVRNRQNYTTTANAMHVHYNTLKYRIGRVSDATGVDFDNPDVIFRIMLAERVIGLLKNVDINEAFMLAHATERA
jgi:sugar diacid utilization regulator